MEKSESTIEGTGIEITSIGGVGTWVQLSVTTYSRKSSYVRKLANGHPSWSDWQTLQPHNHRLLTPP